MKARTAFKMALLALTLCACATQTTFYQLYKTKDNGLRKVDNFLIWENDTCKIGYNLWGSGGDIGFIFQNKTDQDIFIDLDQCYFIINGGAYPYYKNRSYTHSSGASTDYISGNTLGSSVSVSETEYSVPYFFNPYQVAFNTTNAEVSLSTFSSTNFMSSRGYAVTYLEEKTICVPPKTARAITEYAINKKVYRDCELLRFPSSKDVAIKTFDKNTSPVVFGNRITYRIGKGSSIVVFNEFYVNEILNLREDQMVGSENDARCWQESFKKVYFFKEIRPDWFYVEYDKPTTTSYWEY